MEVIMDNNNYQWYPGHMAKAFKIMKEDIAHEHKESMTVIERLQPMFKMNK